MDRPAAPAHDVVFIVGCPRSGTTLVQHLLDAHPDVAVAPETHFVRRFWLQRQKYGDLNEDEALRRLVGDITRMPEFLEMGLDRQQFAEAARTQSPQTYAGLFSLLLEQLRAQDASQLVGEKTPNHALYLPLLKAWFPTAKILYVVRDPRAVVNSWRHVPWSTGSVEGDAAVWRRYASAALVYNTSRADLLSVHYEDLVLDPRRMLETMCCFLGIQFVDGMLQEMADQEHATNVGREPWKARSLQPPVADRMEAWRVELSKPQVAAIESVVWWEMQQWGYAPRTGVVALVFRRGWRALRRKARSRLISAARAIEAPLSGLRRFGGGET